MLTDENGQFQLLFLLKFSYITTFIDTGMTHASTMQTKRPLRQFLLKPPFRHTTALRVLNGAPGVGKGRVHS